MTKPMFEQFADETLDKVRGTYAQRGSEYSDTIGEIRPITLQAILTKLGLPKLDRDALVALIAAALVDVKYWRGLGGWKEDSMIDGIAYQALLVGAVKRVDDAKEAASIDALAGMPPAVDVKAVARKAIAEANHVINVYRKDHGLDAKRGEPPPDPGLAYFQHNAGSNGSLCRCDICEVYRANNP